MFSVIIIINTVRIAYIVAVEKRQKKDEIKMQRSCIDGNGERKSVAKRIMKSFSSNKQYEKCIQNSSSSAIARDGFDTSCECNACTAHTHTHSHTHVKYEWYEALKKLGSVIFVTQSHMNMNSVFDGCRATKKISFRRSQKLQTAKLLQKNEDMMRMAIDTTIYPATTSRSSR